MASNADTCRLHHQQNFVLDIKYGSAFLWKSKGRNNLIDVNNFESAERAAFVERVLCPALIIRTTFHFPEPNNIYRLTVFVFSHLLPQKMRFKDLPLGSLTHQYAKYLIDDKHKCYVLHAPTPHAFIQAAGYLKYTRAKDTGRGVFFRGETKIHEEMIPSLLRGRNENRTQDLRKKLSCFLEQIDFQKRVLRAVPKPFREPLLQHYGIKTTWLDVVDNIWIALWFACHKASTTGRVNEFLHFEKRQPREEAKEESFAYIFLMESAYFNSVDGEPGHYRDERSATVDLRCAAPSQFVRPHAQHGLLIQRLSHKGKAVHDFSDMVIGCIRVDLESALEWLGNAATLSTHALFPPAYYDYGFRELLEHIVCPPEGLGAIHVIQP